MTEIAKRQAAACSRCPLVTRRADERSCHREGAGAALRPGAGGISAFKREGDGATPLAAMRILGGYARGAGGQSRRRRYGCELIDRDLGWCDAPGDRNYNRPVQLPCRASHETHVARGSPLRRRASCSTGTYGRGGRAAAAPSSCISPAPAITPTEGCVALSAADMRRLAALSVTPDGPARAPLAI